MPVKKSTSDRSQRGLTLLELMITIAVLAILVTAGIPQFQRLIQSNQTTSGANDLLSSLQLARSESVRRGSPVTLCPSTDQSTCSGSDWSVGWVVIDPADATAPIRVTESLPGNVAISTQVSAVNFNAVGTTADATSFVVAAGDQNRIVCLEPSGIARVGACQ
ncbi:MAG: GspH/FimT family pseudopilin [Wenzhouxiangella sp.]